MPEADSIGTWGWSPEWEAKQAAEIGDARGFARVLRQERDQFVLMSDTGGLVGVLPGNFRKSGARPVTGDWVTFEPIEGDDKVLIHSILPRKSELARQGAGEKTVKQVIAANVDLVLIVMAFDNDFNLRRLERYLRLVSGRNLEAAILLNKVDQTGDPATGVDAVKQLAGDMAVLPLSAKTGEGMEAMNDMLDPGKTLVCIGSSGVGKSTIINALVGKELLATFEVREGDDRGRHTTTQRELIKLPSGALMIDTPGIRELSEWRDEEEEDAVDKAFAQIEELSLACKFRDCSHKNEPGCAVIAARESGELDEERIASWQKLQAELVAQAKRQEEAERLKSRPVRGRSRRIQTPRKR